MMHIKQHHAPESQATWREQKIPVTHPQKGAGRSRPFHDRHVSASGDDRAFSDRTFSDRPFSDGSLTDRSLADHRSRGRWLAGRQIGGYGNAHEGESRSGQDKEPCHVMRPRKLISEDTSNFTAVKADSSELKLVQKSHNGVFFRPPERTVRLASANGPCPGTKALTHASIGS
jgi:hypothetical protein